ncbi:MAG: hypothetical protein KJZ84_24095 [Bryobacteraceae bacterium]|nr:hypothetical protein [Bryobacteraceae bacterium]
MDHPYEPEITDAAKAVIELRSALKAAVEVIHSWHGDACWDIYINKAPEMKEIREALVKYA